MSRMQMGAPRLDITPFTKQLLIALLALYVLELIAYAWLGIPVYSLFGWHPTQEGFRLWQPLTGYLVQGKDPIWFLVELLMVFFFVPPVQKSFGRKGVYRMVVTTIGVATIFASILIVIGAVSATSGPFMGIGPLVTAAFVVFGMSRPNAMVSLYFVLPVKAIWLAWGSGLLAVLYFLATRDMSSTMWLAGWLGGFVFMKLPKRGGLRSLLIQWKHRRTQQRIRKFTVHDGGKNKDIFH